MPVQLRAEMNICGVQDLHAVHQSSIGPWTDQPRTIISHPLLKRLVADLLPERRLQGFLDRAQGWRAINPDRLYLVVDDVRRVRVCATRATCSTSLRGAEANECRVTMYWHDFCTVPRWNREIIATIGDLRQPSHPRRVACPPTCDARPYSSRERHVHLHGKGW